MGAKSDKEVKEVTITPKHSLEKIYANAQILGIEPCELAGATAGKDPETLYTVEDVKELIQKWKNKEAK